MKKENAITTESQPEVQPEIQQEEKAKSPLVAVLERIAALSQADRLVLYNRLDVIMNDDRQKASSGVDNVSHLFDEAIKSL